MGSLSIYFSFISFVQICLVKKKLKQFYNWFLSLFQTRYKITVSFNKEYGDTDDKAICQKKYLFKKKNILNLELLIKN